MNRMTKTKGNKQGVILVTILFIFCIAMIMIAAALMLTTGTRERLYTRAEKNQARLTVTSAAEAFYQALYMGDISDAELQALASEKANVGLVDTSTPGMGGVAGNKTTVKIRPGDEAGLHSDVEEYVTLEFVTEIDEQTEHVLVVLKYDKPTPAVLDFQNMIETNGDMGYGELVIGANGAGKPDNTILIRGDGKMTNGGTDANYGTVIVTGDFYSSDAPNSMRDATVVLWGTNNKANFSSGNNFNPKGLYFINPGAASGSQSVVNYESKHDFCEGTNEIYINRTFSNHYLNKEPGSLLTLTGTTGSSVAGTTWNNGSNKDLTSKINESIASYGSSSGAAYDNAKAAQNLLKYKGYIDQGFPTLEQAMNTDLSKNLFGGVTASDDLSDVPAANKLNPASFGGTYSGGNYTLSGGSLGGNKYAVFEGDTRLYITGSINWGDFRIYQKSGKLRIYLASGVNIETTEMYGHCGGIYSTSDRSEANVQGNGSASYPAGIGTVTPNCNIYGYGNNQIKMVKGPFVMDSYVSLYNPSGSSNKSEFKMDGQNSGGFKFYGRIKASGVGNTGAGSSAVPYCPGPSSAEDPNKLYTQYSRYKVDKFLYYYTAEEVAGG